MKASLSENFTNLEWKGAKPRNGSRNIFLFKYLFEGFLLSLVKIAKEMGHIVIFLKMAQESRQNK